MDTQWLDSDYNVDDDGDDISSALIDWFVWCIIDNQAAQISSLSVWI